MSHIHITLQDANTRSSVSPDRMLILQNQITRILRTSPHLTVLEVEVVS